MVTDHAGRPLAAAYVIGLVSLTVARTDASGRYSIPCRHEPLVASPWLLPITIPHWSGGAFGPPNTTAYGPVPFAPGSGYAFSGGGGDVGHAAVVACGQKADFALQPDGEVDIGLTDASGKPVSTSQGQVPPDNLYLPGLGDQAALEVAPVAANGHQHLAQLGGGTLRIDGTSSTLHCTGTGVTADPSVGGATVTVTPGTTANVVCKEG
jgi:hypothetical protein